jgi:hypothetical protein
MGLAATYQTSRVANPVIDPGWERQAGAQSTW